MDTVNQNNLSEEKIVTPITPAAKKPAATKLPSKPISFSSQPASLIRKFLNLLLIHFSL